MSSKFAADLQYFAIGLNYFRTRFCQNIPMCKRQGTSTLFLNSKQRRQPHDKLLLSDLLLLYVQKLFFSFQRRAFWRLNQDLWFPVDTQWKGKSSKNRLFSQSGWQINNKRCFFGTYHPSFRITSFICWSFFWCSNEESPEDLTSF